jgi:hypothetical protein
VYRTTRFRYQGNVEWAFDDNGEPKAPGGRQLADSIAAALRDLGARVADVEQHDLSVIPGLDDVQWEEGRT